MEMISKELFGTTAAEKQVYCYTITNNKGNYVKILNYGATIQSICVNDKSGHPKDVCMGYNTVREYETNDGYLGACIGRFGNRIGKGIFTLNDHTYQLALNDGDNHLHGGDKGFDKHIFDVEVQNNALIFSRLSPDGEENYPGNLNISVRYSFNDEGRLTIDYHASSDADTIINLTNHCYFNLSGEQDGTILDHLLQISASAFTENDEQCLPTGKIINVGNTPFDFRQPKAVGQDIELDDIQLSNGKGYDHNFVLDGSGMKKAARVVSPKTGIIMDVYTDKPGIQFYSGNFLAGDKGKSGTAYVNRSGLCLETQYFPNAMACDNFPSPILKAGEEYHFTTTYQFSHE